MEKGLHVELHEGEKENNQRRKMSIEKLEKIIGVPSGTTRDLLAEIKANTVKLDSCSLPHDFKPDDNPNRFRTKFHCSKCSGEVDLTRAVWYGKGMKDSRPIESYLESRLKIAMEALEGIERCYAPTAGGPLSECHKALAKIRGDK